MVPCEKRFLKHVCIFIKLAGGGAGSPCAATIDLPAPLEVLKLKACMHTQFCLVHFTEAQ